jgi:hypothetical protein
MDMQTDTQTERRAVRWGIAAGRGGIAVAASGA